jgi:hypothetical protein
VNVAQGAARSPQPASVTPETSEQQGQNDQQKGNGQ